MSETKITTPILKSRFAKISLFILILTFAGFIISEALRYLNVANIDISIIALAGAAILYAFSSERKEIFKSVDYRTLIFFVAMFIVTSALWYSNAIPMLMSFIPKPDSSNLIQSNAIISATSITKSTFK
jgi:Na+/H+ antiporter NhaD/arsenite permease-like protein